MQEVGDPEPCAGDKNNNIQISNQFFEDENFQFASDDADVRQLDTGDDDVSLSFDDEASDIISLIPRPAATAIQVPKLSFVALDEHARNVWLLLEVFVVVVLCSCYNFFRCLSCFCSCNCCCRCFVVVVVFVIVVVVVVIVVVVVERAVLVEVAVVLVVAAIAFVVVAD